MAASATLALKAGACVRRARLVMVAPDPRNPRRSQAEFPLIDLSEFGRPPLQQQCPSFEHLMGQQLWMVEGQERDYLLTVPLMVCRSMIGLLLLRVERSAPPTGD